MSLLTAANIVAGYGPVDILHGVSLRVAPGEFVTVIGPNGSGKSTLLKAIFGLVPPRSGTLTFAGRDITGVPTERLVLRGLGYVPQSANVFAALTVAENLAMGAFVRKSGVPARINEMYELFPDLAASRRRRAGNLSGGQRQMLALARAPDARSPTAAPRRTLRRPLPGCNADYVRAGPKHSSPRRGCHHRRAERPGSLEHIPTRLCAGRWRQPL